MGLPARMGLGLLVLLAGYRIALNLRLVYPLAAVVSIGVLTFVPTEVFLASMLLARNVADAYAGAYLPVAGGMNAGALVGVLVLGAGGLRLVGVRHAEGLGYALFLMLLLCVWTIVGYTYFGTDGSIAREFVRSASILVMGLVSAGFVRRLADVDRIVAAIVLAAIVPAIVAIVQWLSSGDFTTRASGTLAHPNAAAGVFGLALAAALWMLLERRRSAAYAAAAATLAVAVLTTGSLGGLAQVLVTLLVYAVLT
jgi:hypothetical protein